jgi:hypothetical protein
MLQTYPQINYEGLRKRRDFILNKLVDSMKKETTIEEFRETKIYKKLFKKMRKTQYIEEKYQYFQFKERGRNFKYLTNHFYKEYGYDYWKNVFVFNTTDMNKVLKELEMLGINIDGSSWSSPYDCTGRAFYNPCKFITLSDRIIVLQSGALDV